MDQGKLHVVSCYSVSSHRPTRSRCGGPYTFRGRLEARTAWLCKRATTTEARRLQRLRLLQMIRARIPFGEIALRGADGSVRCVRAGLTNSMATNVV